MSIACGKVGPLHEMVADQPKYLPLREDGRFVMDRSVLEAEDQPGRDPLTVGCLDQVAVCEKGTSNVRRARNHARCLR
jgi:hypothetical protein